MIVIGMHNVEVWTDRDGEVLGAPVFLSPEEVCVLEEEGEVVIRRG